MKRRDIPKAMLLAAGGLQSPGSRAAAPANRADFPRTDTEAAAGIPLPRTDYPPGDIRRYGAMANEAGEPATDNSQIVQRVFNMTRLAGGKISFPGGDWSFYLDISSASDAAGAQVIVEGNGAIFRCFTAKPVNSCVIHADNSGGKNRFVGSNVRFNGCNFIGRRFEVDGHGELDHAVFFNGTSATFYDCSFQYSVVAGFYAMFGQYNEFWSCEFGPCAATPNSTGCYLNSSSANAASNEVLFDRCKFFVCSNFLKLLGCFCTRIRDSTFQGSVEGGRGAIILDADATGQGTVGTLIDGCWFEINRAPHIFGRICQGTRIRGNSFFASGGTNAVTFDFCYDLEVADNVTYTPVEFRVNHPAGDTMKASLVWEGNNFVPALGLDHAGPSYVSMDSPAAGVRRNDNVLITTGQRGAYGIPLVQAELCGFRILTPGGSDTPLFRLNLEAWPAAPYMPACLLEVQLFAWQDTAEPGGYAACATLSRFHAFVTNNGGRLRALVGPAATATDVGTDLPARALGSMSLSAATSDPIPGRTAGSVTFSVSFHPTGSDAASVTSATVAYKLSGAGSNSFTMTRL